jgi:hypothetical protein
MLAARHRSTPALQFANLADAMYSFVRIEFRSLPAWEFLRLPGLALGQPRNLIGEISSFVMD